MDIMYKSDSTSKMLNSLEVDLLGGFNCWIVEMLMFWLVSIDDYQ